MEMSSGCQQANPADETENTFGPSQPNSAREQLVLTLLLHPELSRVGEVAVLEPKTLDRTWWLDRTRTEFSAPPTRAEGGPARPLDTKFASRNSIGIRIEAGGAVHFIVEQTLAHCMTHKGKKQVYQLLRVEGRPVSADLSVSKEQLAAGVVLEFGPWIALVLRRQRAFSDVDREASIEVARALQSARSPDLIGESDAMRDLRVELLRRARRNAGNDTSILVHGPSGSGKEQVVLALHHMKHGNQAPLETTNCSAGTDDFRLDALLGHFKDAFTGAHTDKPGVLERAGNGTVFLDEVAELSPRMQAGLLRAIGGTREIERLGHGRTIPMKAQVIAATHVDLAARVAAGKFRLDLQKRLLDTIEVPPLSARREDIGRLFVHFLSNKLRGREGIDASALESPRVGASGEPWLSARYVAALALRERWDGNIRDLQNVAHRAALLYPEPLPQPGEPGQSEAPPPGARLRSAAAVAGATPESLSSSTDAELLELLRAHHFKLKSCAAVLQCSPGNLLEHCRQRRLYHTSDDLEAADVRRAFALHLHDWQAITDDLLQRGARTDLTPESVSRAFVEYDDPAAMLRTLGLDAARAKTALDQKIFLRMRPVSSDVLEKVLNELRSSPETINKRIGRPDLSSLIGNLPARRSNV